MSKLQKIVMCVIALTAVTCSIYYITNLPPSGHRPALFNKADNAILSVSNDYSDQDNGKADISNKIIGVLTRSERKIIEANINIIPIVPDRERAGCFIPHHFIEYYKADKKIGEVSICFCCAGVAIDGELYDYNKSEIGFNLLQIRRSFVQMGVKTDIGCEE